MALITPFVVGRWCTPPPTNYYGDNMIKKYFVCTKGDDRKLFMVTMDKGLAERCLDDGSCDKLSTIGTVRGYDEIAEMFSMEDCKTFIDLSYKIMYGKQFKTIYGEIR